MALTEMWGTWEELVLGGAVLRHGTADWVVVAEELRSRSAFPHLFTPQVCEAKYDGLQERYSGCDALFEELRKQRVAELKRELEKSEDSIGSLQSKLESLTTDRSDDVNNVDYCTSRAQSISVGDDTDALDYFCKEVSRDRSSAGSFTQNAGGEWTPECDVPASVCVQDDELKVQFSWGFRKDNVCNLYPQFSSVTLKKKRGQRKRKACHLVKETSVGDSETVSCATKVDGEESSLSCKQDIEPSSEKFQRVTPREEPVADLPGILDSILRHMDVSILQSRLESQKKSKYKRMIRRHVDLQSISSGIRDGSLTCAKELFRDLLLLCNNVLVFYGRSSLEHKPACKLRNIVMKHLRHAFDAPTKISDDDGGGNAQSLQPAKAEKLQSRNASVVGKTAKDRAVETAPKRGVGRPPKACQKGVRRHQLESSLRKGGKKARR